MIWIKKIPKFFICYAVTAVIFLCVFWFFGKNIDISEHKDNIADYMPEHTAIQENTENPEDIDIIENLEESGKIYTLDYNYDEPENNLESSESGAVRYYKQRHFREVLISAVGDLTLGMNWSKSYPGSFYEYYDLYGPDYFCENVKPIFDDSDCVIANLECVLTDNNDPSLRQDKPYNYKGYTEYTSILTASSIDVVNLANNHTRDYSETGYNDTINALNNAGVDYCGNGIALIKEINGISVGFIGCRKVMWTVELKRGLDYLTENGAEIKIVSFHWGDMNALIANQNQVNIAHYAIDNGADLVIGHHPHVLQGIEIYKDKYIAYSIGNFIFDGNIISDIENRTSIIFQQRFVLYGSEIVDSSINLIPILGTSNMAMKNWKPMLAAGEQKEAILNKIAERSAGYN